MATLIEWFPPSGTVLAFTTGNAAAYRLMVADGLEPVAVEPLSIKSPNQPGDTAVDVIVPGRVVTLGGLIQAATPAALWTLRQELARSVAQQPTRLGETYALGRLRVTIDGRQPLEVDALPRSTHVPRPTGTKTLAPFDLEFYAPNPYWRDPTDTQVLFTAAGGFAFPITFPLVMPSNNVLVAIDNVGDVDTPIVARLYGDITTARIMNVTTGETLEITGQVVSGKYLEIATGFGLKRVDEVTLADGTRVSAMDRINLSKPDFWALRPGLNSVKFEADLNVSGRAEFYFRFMYSGF